MSLQDDFELPVQKILTSLTSDADSISPSLWQGELLGKEKSVYSERRVIKHCIVDTEYKDSLEDFLGCFKKDIIPSQKTLADTVKASYSKKITPPLFEPTEISIEKFTAFINKWLVFTNTPYSDRERSGLFYAKAYVELYAPNTEFMDLCGLANPHYWKYAGLNWFQSKANIKPSDALSAFFEGPTFPDCGSDLQACVYRAFEEMIGTDLFNKNFSNPITPFLVTRILFDRIRYQEEIPTWSLKQRMEAGNPLLFLFDANPKNFTDEIIDESEVLPGDILNIEGVSNYMQKHIVGFGFSWNLVCVGKNSEGDNLYLGFGPDRFTQPLTFRQVKTILINSYNEEQTLDTIKRIEHYKNIENVDTTDMLMAVKAQTAKLLEGHKVNEDYAINGIRAVIRFNPQKLKDFISQQDQRWFNQPCPELDSTRASSPAKIRHISSLSKEARGKTFDNFETVTPVQKNMLDLAKKFAHTVINTDGNQPNGLIMTGMPGIGKTHLGAAITHLAANNGLNVLYVDENTISNKYQEMGEKQSHKHLELSELPKMDSIFAEWLKSIDLVVLDDINSEYGIGSVFFEQALRYVVEHNKAIFVSSNHPIQRLQDRLDEYYGLETNKTTGFYIVQDLSGESYRQPWWNEMMPVPTLTAAENLSNEWLIHTLFQYSGSSGAGVIIEQDKIDLADVKNAILQFNKDSSIRIAKNPYKNEIVHDLYMHDAHQYDTFIIKVTNKGEAEQLLSLLAKVHDSGKKVIVVSDGKSNIDSLVNQTLSGSLYLNKYAPRLLDRYNNLILCAKSLTKEL